MRGKILKIVKHKYYIVSTEMITKGNYSLLNKEFNTRAEAQAIIDEFLRERRYYNEVVKGDIALKFGFNIKFSTKGKKECYKRLVKYIYPEYDKMSYQDKKSYRTKQRRIWRRTRKRMVN